MTLSDILVFIALSLFSRLLKQGQWRNSLTFIGSIFAVYWLQPAMPVRYLNFWLPTLTIFLAVSGWVITSAPQERLTKKNVLAFVCLLLLILSVGLTRYLNTESVIINGRPPNVIQIIFALVVFTCVTAVTVYYSRDGKRIALIAILIILMIFIIIKYLPLSVFVSSIVRRIMQQDTALASPDDLRWLGFSYLAFRLLHTLRDRQLGNCRASVCKNI